jgi:hypothetical protein
VAEIVEASEVDLEVSVAEIAEASEADLAVSEVVTVEASVVATVEASEGDHVEDSVASEPQIN